MTDIPLNEMEAIVKEFIAESNESLNRLDRDFIELEKHPEAAETIGSIFRTIHSIKGATGFLGFSRLGAVAHIGESLLSRLRDGTLVVNPQITSGLLAMADCIRQMLSNIEETGAEGDVNHLAVVAALTSLSRNEHEVADNLQPFGTSLGNPSSITLETGTPSDATIDTVSLGKSDPDRFSEWPAGQLNSRELSHPSRSDENIRVDVKLLDSLMNLVGELVLTRNELSQFSSMQQDPILRNASQRLNLITTELHEGIMKARMQPIGNLWNKFPRVVRDLALQRNKKIRIEMVGKETALDKTLIEAMTDPLLHLVRNAIDHGLEEPAVRIAAGKPAEGRLLLRAFHEGGQVDIEISDDGAGIDPARIKRKALERGLITPEQARLVDDQQIANLIFLPGFSTADEITSSSGRGVGMDVVKTNVEKIGGKVTVHSQKGFGTTFKIRIPLTLAIMPALVVTAGDERYAIPQVSVVELVRLEGDEVRGKIERLQKVPVYRLRGDLLPLVWLDEELRIKGSSGQVTKTDEVANIVVLQAADQRFGVVVDKVNDTQEIVVKPLGKQLRGLSMFAGATIMGDGNVVLILDVLGLAIHAKVLSEVPEAAYVIAEKSLAEPSEEKQTLLLFAGPDDARMAIPLPQVTRLEEFLSSSLERSGNQDAVQYRGAILPLINIATLLQERRLTKRLSQPASEKGETIQVIVYAKNGYSVGLVVDRIIDTIEQSLADSQAASRSGPSASLVIQERITEILDLEVICAGLVSTSFSKQVFTEAKV